MNAQEIIVIAVFVVTLIYIIYKIKKRFAARVPCDCSQCGIEDCDKGV